MPFFLNFHQVQVILLHFCRLFSTYFFSYSFFSTKLLIAFVKLVFISKNYIKNINFFLPLSLQLHHLSTFLSSYVFILLLIVIVNDWSISEFVASVFCPISTNSHLRHLYGNLLGMLVIIKKITANEPWTAIAVWLKLINFVKQ